jgi:membrane AbrB-like protein
MPQYNVLAFLFLAIFGGWLGSKARFPGSIAVGAMLFSILGNVIGLGPAAVPSWYKTVIQIMAGCIVGASMTRERAQSIKSVLVPVLTNSAILLTVGAGAALLCRHFFHWDLLTSWLAACPGRMADMIIYSGIMQADTAKVVAAHVLRLVLVIFLTPACLKVFGLIFSKPAALNNASDDANSSKLKTQKPSIEFSVRLKNYLCLFLLGCVGGGLGLVSNVAGGVILGAMVMTSLGNLLGIPAKILPPRFGSCLQILAGLLVGVQMTIGELLYIAGTLPELMAIIVLLFAASLFSAWLLISRFHWDPATAWLSASPGRMSDMIILAQSLQARTDWVAGTHVARMILVIVSTPIIIKFA